MSTNASSNATMSEPPTHYGLVVFPGFQALDAFGPLDILNLLSQSRPLTLSILADTLDPVSTKTHRAHSGSNFGQSIVPTHTFDNAPENLEVLLVPGGFGLRDHETTQPGAEFLKKTYPKLKYVITVCTGSVLLARSGALDGKRATTNKRSWDWAVAHRSEVKWVGKARWVVDGNIWTSSGVAAGIDVMYAFVSEKYGEEKAEELANIAEYIRNKDSTHDPFADHFGVTSKS